MGRFGYLEDGGKKKAAKKAKKLEKLEKAAGGQGKLGGPGSGQVEVVYVRRETVRAAWRELKAEGGESLSELVDDLLLGWLQARQRGHAAEAPQGREPET